MKRFVYADNAATTPVLPEVREVMMPFFGEIYGNPSSAYGKGAEAAAPLAKARETIATLLGAKPTEIFFTASGSEADNWAIKGVASLKKPRESISSPPNSSITPCFTPWNLLSVTAMRSPILT